jgi:lysophospholipase L1-like esterase
MNWLARLGDDFFHGVLRVIREQQAVRLARMTPAQLAYFERNEAWGIRARCAAGMTLELRTDSPYLDIRFCVLSSCRRFFGIDVEIDGIVSHAVRIEAGEPFYEGRLFELPGRGPRCIRVHLPYTFEIRLEQVGLAQGASVEPLPLRSHRLLTLGDSITQGMEARSPIASFPVQLARLLDAELLNQGVGGHIFDVQALDPNLGLEPALVIVAYGTNDWGQKDAGQFRRDVREYLRKLRSMWPAERTRIAVVSPLWRATGSQKKHGFDLLDFSRVILEEAAQLSGAVAVDGLTLVPNQPWYFSDGTHPNDAGFLHYAVNLYRALFPPQAGRTSVIAR